MNCVSLLQETLTTSRRRVCQARRVLRASAESFHPVQFLSATMAGTEPAGHTRREGEPTEFNFRKVEVSRIVLSLQT